jgi:adenylate cyclase class IV
MIEVEQRFSLHPGSLAKITAACELVSNRVVHDDYYDNDAFDLTLKDIWFRKRDNGFEVKIGVRNMPHGSRDIDRYEEITDERLIRERLQLDPNLPMEQAIKKANLSIFCSPRTARKKFRKGKFIIDVDSVSFAGTELTYHIVEIERLVDNEDRIQTAKDEIRNFARKFGLSPQMHVVGKVITYIKHERPQHYEALLRSGIIGTS